jgi:hypothetical protein
MNLDSIMIFLKAESLVTRGLSPLPVCVLNNEQLIRAIVVMLSQEDRLFGDNQPIFR